MFQRMATWAHTTENTHALRVRGVPGRATGTRVPHASHERLAGDDGPPWWLGRIGHFLISFLFSFFHFLLFNLISNLNYPNQIQIHVLNFQFTNIKLIPNEDITSSICINIIIIGKSIIDTRSIIRNYAAAIISSS